MRPAKRSYVLLFLTLLLIASFDKISPCKPGVGRVVTRIVQGTARSGRIGANVGRSATRTTQSGSSIIGRVSASASNVGSNGAAAAASGRVYSSVLQSSLVTNTIESITRAAQQARAATLTRISLRIRSSYIGRRGLTIQERGDGSPTLVQRVLGQQGRPHAGRVLVDNPGRSSGPNILQRVMGQEGRPNAGRVIVGGRGGVDSSRQTAARQLAGQISRTSQKAGEPPTSGVQTQHMANARALGTLTASRSRSSSIGTRTPSNMRRARLRSLSPQRLTRMGLRSGAETTRSSSMPELREAIAMSRGGTATRTTASNTVEYARWRDRLTVQLSQLRKRIRRSPEAIVSYLHTKKGKFDQFWRAKRNAPPSPGSAPGPRKTLLESIRALDHKIAERYPVWKKIKYIVGGGLSSAAATGIGIGVERAFWGGGVWRSQDVVDKRGQIFPPAIPPTPVPLLSPPTPPPAAESEGGADGSRRTMTRPPPKGKELETLILGAAGKIVGEEGTKFIVDLADQMGTDLEFADVDVQDENGNSEKKKIVTAASSMPFDPEHSYDEDLEKMV